MSHKLTKPLEDGAAYVRHCKNHDNAKSWRYSGDHFTVEATDGRATICDSNRELKPWLRKKIMLELIAIGLGVLFIAVLVLPFAI
jgi:hypothetical protein